MAAGAVARPLVLKEPGFLFIAPIGSTEPTATASGGTLSDQWPAAWIPLGATQEGSTFNNAINVEPIEAAEFFDPISYEVTSRESSIAFALKSFTLTNYRRAMNGGVAALTPTSGSGPTALYEFEPPTPGTETRAMIGWESLDATMRVVIRQAFQGGEISTDFKKSPDTALIPCTYQIEVPATGLKPWKMVSTRG